MKGRNDAHIATAVQPPKKSKAPSYELRAFIGNLGCC